MPEELYKLELTSSQLKTLYKAFSYAGTLYTGQPHLAKEAYELIDLFGVIRMQAIEGEEI